MPSQLDYNADPDIAEPGMPARPDFDASTRFNAEASAGIPFAFAVKYGAAQRDALLPSAATSKLQGITMKSHAMEQAGPFSDLDSNMKVVAGAKLSVMTKGEIWAVCQDGCNPGDPLHVRWEAGSDALIGSLRATADSTHTIDCTNNGRWQQVATAGAVARLKINFDVAPGTPTAGN